MTIQQLQYVTSVEKYQTFTAAAEKCFVTQPTLTMQIKKLEEELGISLFDRSKTPVKPTAEGKRFIIKAREILESFDDLKSAVNQSKGDLKGTYKLGIIPTVAPYLLPYFLPEFTDNHPETNFHIKEMTTSELIRALHDDRISMAIASTPLDEKDLVERKLYIESFLLYSNENGNSKRLKLEDIEETNLLLMDEGHCFRNQTINLCRDQEKLGKNFNFKYLGGSILGLVNLVDRGLGMTLIPELASGDLQYPSKLKKFESPEPAREISLIYHKRFNHDKLIETLADSIILSLPNFLTAAKVSKKIIPWKS